MAAVTGAISKVQRELIRDSIAHARLGSFISRRFPEVTVIGRSPTLANIKRMGWILDDAGRAIRHVPIDL